MKTSPPINIRWKLALWLSFLAATLLFVFGAMVNVDFTDPSVPFSQALASVRWERALSDPGGGDFHLVFAAAVVAVIFYSDRQSWRVRLGVISAALLTPVLTVGVVMLCMPFLAPWMIGGALMGNVDGEFYGEGMLPVAAVGLWMDVCLVFAARELWLRRGRRNASDLTMVNH